MSLKKLLMGGAASVLLLGGLAAPAHAASLISNGSFETGTNPGVFSTLFAGNNTSIPGWTVTAGTIDYIGTYWEASDGDRSLDLTGFSAGAVSQTFTTVPGHTYLVTFDLAGNPAGPPTVKNLNVDTGAAPTPYTFDVTGHTLADMGWEQKTYEFTATGASTTLTFASATAGFFGPALDNVVVTDVPTDPDQCKNGGWAAYTDPSFKNQGDCVSYIQSNPHAIGN